MENNNWLKERRCSRCLTPMDFSDSQQKVTCVACGWVHVIPVFTQEERRLRDAVDEASEASRRAEQAVREAAEEFRRTQSDYHQQARALAEENSRRLTELFESRFAQLQNSRAYRLQNRYELAEAAQHDGDFDRAVYQYEELIAASDHPEPDLHWRLVLCRWAVEYVQDAFGTWQPTVGRPDAGSLTDSRHYILAVRSAPPEAREFYEREAAAIERLLDASLTIRAQQPCDVIIAAATSDIPGWQRAAALRAKLEQQGRSVCFAGDGELFGEVPPEAKLMAALVSAKLVVLAADTPEALAQPQMRSVWRRFLMQMKKDPARRMIVHAPWVPTEAVPKEIRSMHAVNPRTENADAVLDGLLKELFSPRGGGFAGEDEADALLTRAEMLLEEGNFRQAYENCQAALNKAPTLARGYILSLCAELRVRSPRELAGQSVALDTRDSYHRALKYADAAARRQLEEWNAAVSRRASAPAFAPETPQLSRPAWAQSLPLQTVAAGFQQTLAVREDGTVLAAGALNVSDWREIVAVAAGRSHAAGLRADGSVVAVGDNTFGQCNVAAWRNVVSIAAGENHTLGLRSDGTLLLTGWQNDGWQAAQTWRNIVSVSMSEAYLVGLRGDGTVAVADRGSRGLPVAGLWKNVIQVAAGASHVAALKFDGTVVAAGGNSYRQCDVRSWTDVAAIAAGDGCTLGLRRDGTAIACGMNQQGQCMVGGWRDVARVWSGRTRFVGLRRDGTLVMTNPTYEEAQALPGWQNVAWAATNPSRTVVVMTDGSVAAAGFGSFGECNVSGWTNVRRPF